MQWIKKHVFLLVILLLTVGTYFSSLSNDFTHLDDYVHVVKNPNIRSLNIGQVNAIFSSTTVGMYQPVSTLFYAICYNFLGKEAVNFHCLSLFFHLLNISLVVILLSKFDVEKSKAILFAGIFAFHPMQVESVAWVSAFSNLAYSCFYLAALIHYRNYTLGKQKAYIFTLIFFLLSLFSKSTAVTLPVVLLAMDYFQNKKITTKAWLNKIPFFILSIIFGVITIYSRESAGHLSDLSIQFDWFDRIFLIAYSVLFYPVQWVFPFELSAFYPYPEISNGMIPWVYYLSLPLLVALLIFTWLKRKNTQLFFGVLFYLFSIAVVIQIIPVGNQLTTDRYIYLPMIGLMLILNSLLPQQWKKSQYIIFGCWALLLMIASQQRSKVWANDGLIWEDVIEKYPNVAQAYNNLGSYELKNGKTKQAFEHFNRAVKLKPYYADALSNRGNLYSQMGNSSSALNDFNKAIEFRPHADAYFNRANEYSRMGEYKKAIDDYQASAALKKSADTFTNWAYALLQLKNISEAKSKLQEAINLDDNFSQAHFLNGMISQQEGNFSSACQHFKKASKQNHPQANQALQRFCR